MCCESKAQYMPSVCAFQVEVSRITPTQTAKRNERGGQCGNPTVEGITKSHTLLTFGTKMIALPLSPVAASLISHGGSADRMCRAWQRLIQTGRLSDSQEHPKLRRNTRTSHFCSFSFETEKRSFCFTGVPKSSIF